jgi:adenosine deaminase
MIGSSRIGVWAKSKRWDVLRQLQCLLSGKAPRNFALVLSVLFCPLLLRAKPQTNPRSTIQSDAREQRAASAFAKARSNPLELHDFLFRMPKGGDLHNHLDGAVYAESWIRSAAQDNLCVALASLSFTKAVRMTQDNPPQPVCGEGQVSAAQAVSDQGFYDKLVDAFSMRGFVPAAGVTGHDHFFDTFLKFGEEDTMHAPQHMGERLDEVATRAATQNEQYLELMVTPDFTRTATIAAKIGWREDLGGLRQTLLAAGLRDDVVGAHAVLNDAERQRRTIEHCGETGAAAACSVQIRYLYQVLRGFSKEQVFAQTLLGFEIAAADSRVLGVNFVMAEDGAVSMRDYEQHMQMVNFLHGLYPQVHLSLHAGELAPGLVPPEGLCCHIRLAVEQGHAERIGHGVDVMYEERPLELLKEMASKHVMVEINLTSNDGILGVSGKEDPLPIFLKYDVPVALSTDDEGVSRIDLTHEFARAVETYDLSYSDLKRMVRTSLEHSFLPGTSLWRGQDAFTGTAVTCSGDSLGADNPSSGCAAFLRTSERAAQQWELERRLRKFEAGF